MLGADLKYRNSRYIAILAAAFCICSAYAQELRENLEVEGSYIQDIRRAERINTLPELMDFPLGEGVLNYEERGVNADFSPASPAVSATVWGAERDKYPDAGYLDMSLGSFLNSNLSAGVTPLKTKYNKLDIRLQHNSTSLWHPLAKDALNSSESPARFNYQEQLGVDYYHNFRGVGSFIASAQYHLGYFNYYGLNPNREIPDIPNSAPGDKFRFPTQTLNDAALALGWRSRESIHSSWYADFGARYFGYRTATRETMLKLAGGYERKWSPTTRIGFDAEGKVLLYDTAPEYSSPENYGDLRITPFYEWRKNAMRLRIGVNLNFTFNADGTTPDTHYSAFHISPDVKFDVSSSKVGFYFNLLGGEELQTLAATSQLNPYRNPHLESTLPMYSPIDANLGFSITPFSGFAARINFRYKASKYAPMGGWYMALLNYGDAPMPGLEIPQGCAPAYGRSLDRYNLSGFGVGASMEYSAGDVFKIGVDGNYTPQHGTAGLFNGLDRPRWILNAEVSARLIKRLRLALRYQYRGVRRIYTSFVDPNSETLLPGGVSQPDDESAHPSLKTASLRLKDVINLTFRASWMITKNFSVTFDVENILNRHEELLPDLQGEGITFRGGLQCLF